jgi:alpha-ketoglutarate-dependent taurine dioxygenase
MAITEFRVTPLDKTFGAVIEDVDLRALTAQQFQRIYDLWLDYALLIFPQQNLSTDEQSGFAMRFGTLIEGLEAVEISNVQPDGSLRTSPDDDMMKIIRGNMEWHQDSTYMPVQAKGAVFSAHQVPRHGGDTAFADMRAAWQALPESEKQRLSELAAYHSLIYSQQRIGEATKAKDSEYIGYGLDVETAPLRGLMKLHPETQKPSLAIGRHAYGIPGLSPEASETLLDELMDFATGAPERVYQHQWQAGDAVIWDNRCLLHRACDWDFKEPRIMVHSRIAGDDVSEAALN